MLVLYDFGIKIYQFLIFIYQFFNHKAKLWIEGRKDIFEKIAREVDSASKCAWFHFASLGEFEQGRPVLEKLKEHKPKLKIIITFFSPSGYELRKNYPGADHIFYLPIDTPKNAKRFVRLINPELAVFTKYEFWYHYFNEIHRNGIPLYIISGIFRPSQPFFKWYGQLNRKILSYVTHFFVQDQGSKDLLNSININNVTVSGDTRFDRVAENALNPKRIETAEFFCKNHDVFVAGSTWPDDEKLIAGLIKEYPAWKFIIAPHEIKEDKINALIEQLPEGSAVRFSQLPRHAGVNSEKSDSHLAAQGNNISSGASVLIIDNIGMLSSLYQYGSIAYIGGGFGVGIHNTLEAAAFAIPVIFGPNHQKFLEAKALAANGGGFTIKSDAELKAVMNQLQDTAAREKAGKAAGDYVQHAKGAAASIIQHIDHRV